MSNYKYLHNEYSFTETRSPSFIRIIRSSDRYVFGNKGYNGLSEGDMENELYAGLVTDEKKRFA